MSDWTLPTLAMVLVGYAAVSGRLQRSVTVALSVLAHGITAWPGANRYADWYEAHTHDHPSMPESTPVTVPRYRREPHDDEHQ